MLVMILFAAGELLIACYFSYSMLRFRHKSWQRTVALIFFLLGALAVTIEEPITYRMITEGKFLRNDSPAYLATVVGHVASLLALLDVAYKVRRRQN
jgi:hypothetical protein